MRFGIISRVLLGLVISGCASSGSGTSTGTSGATTFGTTSSSTTSSSSGSHGSTASGSSSSGSPTGSSSSGGGPYQLALVEADSISLYAISPSGSAQPQGNFAAASEVFTLQWSPVSNQIGVVQNTFGGYNAAGIEVYSTAGASIASFGGYAFGWSPDGTQLVFSDENDQVRVGQVSSGGQSSPLESDPVESPAWAPSGSSRISYIDQESNGYEYDPQLIVASAPGTGSTQFVAADQVYSYLWSPDGSRIAFMTQVQSEYYYSLCDLGIVQITDVGVSSDSPLVQNLSCPTSVAWSPDSSRLGLAWQNLFVVSASAASTQFSSLTGLLTTPIDVYQLEWTPDGQYIGFLSASASYYDGSSDFLLESPSGGSPLTVLSGVGGTAFDVHR